MAMALALPALWGLIAAWWTPRGPLTTFQVLAAMAIGLAVGWFAGSWSGSRWAMLTSPVTFAVVFEIFRIGAVGPTVDAPASSTYGVFALVVGRGYHGLVALVPMVLGAALGAGPEGEASPVGLEPLRLGDAQDVDPARGGDPAHAALT